MPDGINGFCWRRMLETSAIFFAGREDSNPRPLVLEFLSLRHGWGESVRIGAAL